MSDSFRHWQEKKIDHAASMANVTLAMSLGAMAFIFTLLDKKTDAATGFWSSTGYLGALMAFFLSSSFAFFGMSSRLEDLQATAQAARLRETHSGDRAQLEQERERARKAGIRTNRYLAIQLILFIVGVCLLSGVVIEANLSKLYPRMSPPQAGQPVPTPDKRQPSGRP